MQEWLAGRGPGLPCLEHWMSPLEPGAVSEGGEWEAEGRGSELERMDPFLRPKGLTCS